MKIVFKKKNLIKIYHRLKKRINTVFVNKVCNFKKINKNKVLFKIININKVCNYKKTHINKIKNNIKKANINKIRNIKKTYINKIKVYKIL